VTQTLVSPGERRAGRALELPLGAERQTAGAGALPCVMLQALLSAKTIR